MGLDQMHFLLEFELPDLVGFPAITNLVAGKDSLLVVDLSEENVFFCEIDVAWEFLLRVCIELALNLILVYSKHKLTERVFEIQKEVLRSWSLKVFRKELLSIDSIQEFE